MYLNLIPLSRFEKKSKIMLQICNHQKILYSLLFLHFFFPIILLDLFFLSLLFNYLIELTSAFYCKSVCCLFNYHGRLGIQIYIFCIETDCNNSRTGSP